MSGNCDKEEACGTCESAGTCDEKTKQAHEERLLRETLSRIRHKIFVLSGKGGVGKSSVAVNLATSLAVRGYKTGILDIDIHGPNISKMLGTEGTQLTGDAETGKMEPYRPYPLLKAVSMAGLLPDSDSPVIWRGPPQDGCDQAVPHGCELGRSRLPRCGFPPGTGDEPLSVAQLIPEADGTVIVTTPQEVALLDSRKCVNFAHRVNLPVLGIVENMSGLHCPHCNGFIPLFSQGGGKQAAEELDVPFLGSLPIDPLMPQRCDSGKPLVLLEEENELKQAIDGVVQRLIDRLEPPSVPRSSQECVREPSSKEGGEKRSDARGEIPEA